MRSFCSSIVVLCVVLAIDSVGQESASADCWNVEARYCCEGQPVNSYDCNGETCYPVFVQNDIVHSPVTVKNGYLLSQIGLTLIPKRCKVRVGLCDHTVNPPQCIVDDDVTTFPSCSDYAAPTYPPTCSG